MRRLRTKQVYLVLTEDEVRELKAIQAVLRLPYREFLMIGARHAQARYDQERQSPRRPE